MLAISLYNVYVLLIFIVVIAATVDEIRNLDFRAALRKGRFSYINMANPNGAPKHSLAAGY